MGEAHNKLTKNFTWSEIVEKAMDQLKLDDKGFRDWMMSLEGTKHYCFNPALYHTCYQIWKKINNGQVKKDHFIVIVGNEGSGKSQLGLQMGAIIDPTFDINRICYSPEDFIKRTLHSTPGESFLIDEGSMMLFSRQTMSKGNVNLVQIVQLMRQLRLCTIICIPTFEQLDGYIRRHRIDTLIEVLPNFRYRCVNSPHVISYINNEIRKGFKLSSVQLKSHYRFLGYFNKDFPIVPNMNWDDYEVLKRDQFKQYAEKVLGTMRDEDGEEKTYLTPGKAAKMIGVSRETIVRMVKNGKIEGLKVGKEHRILESDLKKIQDNMKVVPDNQKEE